MKCTRHRCHVALRILVMSGLQPLMRVGDHQLGAAQAASGQAAQELDPERFGLAVPRGHAEHLSPAVGVHAHRHDDGHGDDLMVTADFDVGGVEPNIRPVAFDRPGEERARVHRSRRTGGRPGSC